jgi:quercetin dioxygenase-like cupin family protein
MLRSRVILSAVAFALLSSVAAAATAPIIVTPDTVKWQPVQGLKGWQMAMLVGDPDKPGAYYAYLLKVAAGARVAPHFHRMTENVTVISGSIMFGVGDTMNVSKMSSYGPGSFVSVPAGVHHYAMSQEGAVIEISGIGPDVTTMLHK